jgi:predicted esterase
MVHEHHITVSRTARFYVLGEPGPAVRDLWIACHGYGQLASDFVDRMSTLASPTRVVVAPEGLSRFYDERAGRGSHATSPVGASWMTREDRLAEIGDQVAYLDAVVDAVIAPLGRDSVRVTALGFSQGVATICRWVVRTPVQPVRIVCWGGAVPEDVKLGDLTAFRRADVCLVAGVRDEFATAKRVADEMSQLQSVGLTPTLLAFDGGHRLDNETLSRLAATRDGAFTPP